jgi:flagellar basal-body rod protein FlgF
MDSGYYAACAGLASQLQALETVANNLANTGTAGYRAQKNAFRSLLVGTNDATRNPLNSAINDFGVLGETRLDLSSGTLSKTGGPLDLAIAGKAFFVLQSPDGVRYTRNGGFHRTTNGLLVTARGDSVLGELGPISLPNGTVSVSADGTISVDGAIAARLRMAEFAPGTALTPAGDALYASPAGTALAATTSSVQQGMIEGSNVTAVEGVVDLISIQRNAEMMQRAVTLFDSQLNQTAVQDLPRV